MAKKSEGTGVAEQAPPVDRETLKAVLKVRASELQWDPEHLREFLSDLVDML